MTKRSKTEINNQGYRVFSDSKKLVHRWAAEKKIGRKLKKTEEVHHLDGDRLNNNKDNLIVLSKEDHFLLQEYEKKFYCKGAYAIKKSSFTMMIVATCMLAIGCLIQIPLFWIPYGTQIFTLLLIFPAIILIAIAMIGGVKKIE